MSNHLKILLYIGFVAAIFYFVQNKYNLFDIHFTDSVDNENSIPLSEGITNPFVEIYNIDQSIVRVNIEVADEDYERISGLSGRKELGDYNGMLFVFDTEGGYSFWMRDMFIPLDMIFIDSKGFIVDIREGLQPCKADFCPNVLSSVPFKYALEVNSGFVKTNRMAVGNSVVLNLKSN